MARDILLHPTAKDKFKLDQCQSADGRSPLHLVAEQGNAALWNIAVLRPDCDQHSRNSDGNTPLMCAVIGKKLKILDAWLKDKERAKAVDQTLANNEGKTLVMLFIEHLPHQYLRYLLNTVDTKASINQVDKNGNTALLMASQMSKWTWIKELLINPGVKIGDTEDDLEGTVDVHPTDKTGLSALTIQMLAQIKLARAEQTYNMKKQRVLANEAKREQEQVWDLIKHMLIREKEQHGPTMTQGRDCGIESIRKQFSVAKLIRPQAADEVVQEFVKLYNVIKRKKPPANVPKAVDNSANQITSMLNEAKSALSSTPVTAAPAVTAPASTVASNTPSAPITLAVATAVSITPTTSVIAGQKTTDSPNTTNSVNTAIANTATTTQSNDVIVQASKSVQDLKTTSSVTTAHNTSSSPKTKTAPNEATAEIVATQTAGKTTPGEQRNKKANLPIVSTNHASDSPKPETTPAAPTRQSPKKSKSPPNLSDSKEDSPVKNKSPSTENKSDNSSTKETSPSKKSNGLDSAKSREMEPNDDSTKNSLEGSIKAADSSKLVNGEKPATEVVPTGNQVQRRFIPGKLVKDSPELEEADGENSPPLAPVRKSKKKTTDIATQTEPIGSVPGCICCCTCQKR